MGSVTRQGVLLCAFIASLAVLTWQIQHAGGIQAILSVIPLKSPTTSSGRLKHDQWSLTTVTSAFRAYENAARAETQRMRDSFGKLSPSHLDVIDGASIDYPSKLGRLDQATTVNAVVTSAITDLALRELGVNGSEVEKRDGGSLFRTREVLLHFVRDWSEEGADERNVIFEPILDALRDVPEADRGAMRVLVPGSGLGRLAWEISQLGTSSLSDLDGRTQGERTDQAGFKATANELSWYMNLGLRFLIHPSATSTVHQHTIQPFSHRFSNQRTNDLLFRSTSFADVVPRYSSHFTIAEGDFLRQSPPIGENGTIGYEYIVTEFFIDTGLDIAATLEQIYSLLAPGGLWINFGPLLWSGGGSVSMELSLDETLALAKGVGFEVLGEESGESLAETPRHLRRRSVACEYTADKMGTFQRIYHAEFWVAKKAIAANA